MTRQLWLAVVLIATAFFVTPAQARCGPTEPYIQEILEYNPSAELRAHFTGARAGLFMEMFNAIPPVSEVTADEILIIHIPRHPYALVVWIENNCTIYWSEWLFEKVEVFLERIEGAPA